MSNMHSSSSRGSRSSRGHGSTSRTPLSPDYAVPSIERDDGDDISDGSSSDSRDAINTPTSSTSPVSPSAHRNHPQPRRSQRSRQTSRRHVATASNGENPLDLAQMNAALEAIDRGSQQARRTASSSLQPSESFNPAAPQGSSRRSSRPSHRPVEPPHNVQDETVPNDRFNNSTFQQALADSQSVAAELRDVLGSSDLHSQPTSVMRRLHQQSVTLADFRPSATRKVGFVGDSGVGKSSLLNSLLDVEVLARTSSGGSACTCVATEYHYHDRSDFIIEIDHFTEQEIDEQLEDLLRAYRHYHRHRNDPDVQDHEEKAKLAFHTFKAMFGARLGATTRAAQKVPSVNSLLGQDRSAVLRTLRDWAREAITSLSIASLLLDTSAQTSDELARLTSETPGRRQTLPWPFIRSIKVFLNANILSQGLVLIDLPGLRDMNTARRNITERYMTHGVDEIFVVHPIGRAVTDESVREVFDLAARAGLSNVGVVCTRIDDINPREAVSSMTGARRARLQRQIEARDEAKWEHDWLRMELANFDLQNLTAENAVDWAEASRKEFIARGQLDAAEFELYRSVVQHRNTTVTTGLTDVYESQVPPGTLKIFCVSNNQYWDYRTKSRSAAMPRLELSGILQLRQHCRSMVSESQYRLACDYMQNHIPVLLGEVGLWVTSTESGSMDAERRRVIRQGLRRLESRLRRDIEHDTTLRLFGAGLKHKLRTTLVTPAELRVRTWSRAATSASSIWGGWHHASYAAFCRNYGDYSTPKAGTHCWNQEAIEKMTQDMQPMLSLTMIAIRQPFDAARAAIKDALDHALEIIDDDLEEHSDMVLPVRTALISMQRLLEEDMHGVRDTFHRSLRLLQIETLSSIRTSITGQFMESYYQDAIYESGSGSHDRRKSKIRSGFSNEELFHSVLDGLSEKFGELADELHEQINSVVDEHLERVRDALEILQSDNAAREGDENPEFRNAVRDLVDEATGEMDRIISLIEDGDEDEDSEQED